MKTKVTDFLYDSTSGLARVRKSCLLLSCFMLLTPAVTFAKGNVRKKPVAVKNKTVISSPALQNDPFAISTVWTAYDSFNKYLLDSQKNIYKLNTTCKAAVDRANGAAAIWCQPMYCDMAMNAYKLARKIGDKQREQKYRKLCADLFAGNKKHYVNFDFDDCNENTGWFIYDDIQWWTITLARAYQLLKVDSYLKDSEASFARVWYGSKRVGDCGSYADPKKGLAGGMIWEWQPIPKPRKSTAGDGKMSCINFPTVVAALTLYNNVPSDRAADPNPERWSNSYGDFVRPHYETKASYLAKGKEIYAWAVKNLVDLNTGKVADSKHGNNNPDWTTHVYNQATFIGASVLLYKATGDKTYLDNAVKGADYAVNVMSAANGLLPFESGIEQGIYTAIFSEYIAMLVYDCGQTQYLPFLRRNISYGWANRDTSRNICGGEYQKLPGKGAEIDSYSASGIPALMLLFSGK